MLTARPLSVWDTLFCWRLANEPSVRAASLDPTPPTVWGHVRWMLAWLFERDRQAWVLSFRLEFTYGTGEVLDTVDVPVGLARVRIEGGWLGFTDSVISVATHPDSRGRGVGLLGVQIASDFAERHGWPTPVAYIKADNHPSIGLFAKAGYEMIGARDGLCTMRRKA